MENRESGRNLSGMCVSKTGKFNTITSTCFVRLYACWLQSAIQCTRYSSNKVTW